MREKFSTLADSDDQFSLRVRPRISRTLRCGARPPGARSDDDGVPPLVVRRGEATPQMAAGRRNLLSDHRLDRSASPRRVARRLRTEFPYAALLAPCAARSWAQRRAREILGRTLRAPIKMTSGHSKRSVRASSDISQKDESPSSAYEVLAIPRCRASSKSTMARSISSSRI